MQQSDIEHTYFLTKHNLESMYSGVGKAEEMREQHNIQLYLATKKAQSIHPPSLPPYLPPHFVGMLDLSVDCCTGTKAWEGCEVGKGKCGPVMAVAEGPGEVKEKYWRCRACMRETRAQLAR